MHSQTIWSMFLWVPLLTMGNQACMKLLAATLGAEGFSVERLLASPYAYGILICEIASFLLWLRVLAQMSVARAVPISAVAYLLILGIGWLGFGEPFAMPQVVGSVFILLGVWLLATPSRESSITLGPVV